MLQYQFEQLICLQFQLGEGVLLSYFNIFIYSLNICGRSKETMIAFRGDTCPSDKQYRGKTFEKKIIFQQEENECTVVFDSF